MIDLRLVARAANPRHRRAPDRVQPACFCKAMGKCLTCRRWARHIQFVREWRLVFKGVT
jgi:hypothetical protein